MNLKDDKQQNIQIELDFSSALTGEAREAGREETESSGVTNGAECRSECERGCKQFANSRMPQRGRKRFRRRSSSDTRTSISSISIALGRQNSGKTSAEKVLAESFHPTQFAVVDRPF